jgi:hypothetical protein
VSEQTSGTTGITCPEFIKIEELLGPLLLSSMFKEEGKISIDVIMDAYIQDAITKKLISSINLPQDFKDLGNVICMTLELGKVKTLQAALRGEQPQEAAGIEKALDMIVNLQVLAAVLQALGGSESGGGSSSGSGSGGG